MNTGRDGCVQSVRFGECGSATRKACGRSRKPAMRGTGRADRSRRILFPEPPRLGPLYESVQVTCPAQAAHGAPAGRILRYGAGSGQPVANPRAACSPQSHYHHGFRGPASGSPDIARSIHGSTVCHGNGAPARRRRADRDAGRPSRRHAARDRGGVASAPAAGRLGHAQGAAPAGQGAAGARLPDRAAQLPRRVGVGRRARPGPRRDRRHAGRGGAAARGPPRPAAGAGGFFLRCVRDGAGGRHAGGAGRADPPPRADRPAVWHGQGPSQL
ncbi:hypothetical protein D3C81_1064600 [compost metagenome]